MAIRPIDEYTGKVATDANYPDGKAQNITSPGDGTGTPWEAKLVNDIFGFQQYLTNLAGITPSGTPDNASTSQYFQAIWKLLNVRPLTYNIVSDVDLTLTAAQNIYAKITITDTGVVLTTGRNVILDNVGRMFIFTNSTAQTLTVKTAAGTGVAIPAGGSSILINNGTGVTLLTTAAPTTDYELANKKYVDSKNAGVSSSYYSRSETFDAMNEQLTIPDVRVTVNGVLVLIASETIAINTSGYWDNSAYSVPANRAGKDFYIYALEAGGYILSNNSTYPTGYTSNNSRKIAGFHCLCANAGTITGHSLTGYLTGDILPRSLWDLKLKPRSAPEGMARSLDGQWVDIYLPSWDGTKLVSLYGGTVADGGNGWHTYKFEQRFGMIGKKLIRQTEFVVASLGSNQGTNIAGSADPGTTGGHTDTAGRRMISDIGCEDMCGAYWQWSRDPGGSLATASSYANAYDGNDTGVAGQHYAAPYRGALGGDWNNAARCGSRASDWNNSPLHLGANGSGRGVAESVDSQF
jgi:hypothetical protein